jgi:DNA-directed RNA polymerase subunit RPC12/RpoP
MQDVYECDKCHKSITAEQAKSNLTCPHCGVFWASKPNEVRSSAAIGAAGLIGFIVGLFVIALVVVGVIAVPVVIIVVIVRVCSKPVAPPSESPFGAPKNPWG